MNDKRLLHYPIDYVSNYLAQNTEEQNQALLAFVASNRVAVTDFVKGHKQAQLAETKVQTEATLEYINAEIVEVNNL